MNTRQSKVKPIVVEVAIRNAIARRMRDHGIAQFDTIADEVVLDLFGTRIVPTPDGVPTGFLYQGTNLNWPQGVDTRAVTDDEAATYTRLFSLSWDNGLLPGESVTPPKVTTENNAAHLRMAYEALWARVKNGKAQVDSPPAVEAAHKSNCACAVCYSEGVGAIVSAKANLVADIEQMTVSKHKKAKARKKVEPVVPKIVMSTFEQELADLDALMADL